MTDRAAARPHPPSSRRIVEARASGHLPRAPLAGFGLALLALLACTATLGPRAAGLCADLLRVPVALVGTGAALQAQARAGELVQQLAALVGVALGSVVLAVALGVFLVQGPAFAQLSRPSTASASFAKTSISRTASVLWCLGVVLISALSLSRWRELAQGNLTSLLAAWAQQLALLSAALMVVDIAFARARFFASLWLTRRERDDELRDAYGAPELRAARRQARLQLGQPLDPAAPRAGT